MKRHLLLLTSVAVAAITTLSAQSGPPLFSTALPKDEFYADAFTSEADKHGG